MSKVKIQGNSSGTGTFTVSAPNSNTDRSITLPDGAGEILLANGDGSNLTGITTGKVLQVVQETTNSNIYTASSSDTATGFTASITPSSTSNKIYFILSGGAWDYYDTGTRIQTQMRRSIGGGSYTTVLDPMLEANLGSPTWALPHSASYLDSPATTSEVTYQPYFKSSAGSGVAFNNNFGVYVTLTLMEIAG